MAMRVPCAQGLRPQHKHIAGLTVHFPKILVECDKLLLLLMLCRYGAANTNTFNWPAYTIESTVSHNSLAWPR
jgi:hypothetical protein